MSNYEPQDGLNVVLNFKDHVTGSTNLNFGPEIVYLDIDAVIDTQFIAKIESSETHFLQLNAVIDTRINDAELSLIEIEPLHLNTVIDTRFSAHGVALDASQLLSLDVVIDTGFIGLIDSIFNINHQVGVLNHQKNVIHQASKKILDFNVVFDVADRQSLSNKLYFQKALGVQASAKAAFDVAANITTNNAVTHDLAASLHQNTAAIWDETQRLRLYHEITFDNAESLNCHANPSLVQLHRLQQNFDQSFNLGQNTELHFDVQYQDGLEITVGREIPWGMGRPIYYRKHPVLPWPTPTKPQYQGSTDLNFICLCEQQDSHNVVLNFGADECLPALQNRKWWRIVNEIEVSRLDNGQIINVIDGSYNCSRSAWAWAYSIKVPASEINKFAPIGNQPLILKIVVNGNEHHMLVENAARSETFGKIYYTFTGRSQTALLSADYAPTRSFLQENERTSVQLVQAELDRVNSTTQLDWQLIDALGWIVESESLSYTNLSPIDVIKLIVEAGGGFIYSNKASNQINIKLKYKKTYWEPVTTEDYDRLLPISLVTQHDTSFETLDAYNAIDLINPNNGDVVRVKRSGTAGDIKPEVVNNALFNAVSGASFGRAALARAGELEDHSFTLPITQEVGEFTPGELISFDGRWRGIVDAVSVNFSYSKVTQNIQVERVKNE